MCNYSCLMNKAIKVRNGYAWYLTSMLFQKEPLSKHLLNFHCTCFYFRIELSTEEIKWKVNNAEKSPCMSHACKIIGSLSTYYVKFTKLCYRCICFLIPQGKNGSILTCILFFDKKKK